MAKILIALIWLTAAFFFVTTVVAVIISPSDTRYNGHCYRVEERPGIQRIAGLRDVDIPCP